MHQTTPMYKKDSNVKVKVVGKDIGPVWAEFKKSNPGIRIRNAAEMLGVSELALLCSEGPGKVVRLAPVSAFSFVKGLPVLGEVLALMRNNHCVHEVTGSFSKARGNDLMALNLGQQDQRYFLNHWCHYFSVNDGERSSIQIFDCYGNALWKLYATVSTNMQEWRNFVSQLTCDKNYSLNIREEVNEKKFSSVPSDASKNQLLEKWSQMQDVHQFHSILKSLQFSRQTAYEIAESVWTQEIASSDAERILRAASQQKVPLMIFTANRGIVQIFTGEVASLRRTGPWFNVLDPDFNLHLDTDAIKRGWKVTRPSKDGMINSVEFFDEKGDTIVTIFGKRQEGETERADWRKIISGFDGGVS